jgi:hypothetical protein
MSGRLTQIGEAGSSGFQASGRNAAARLPFRPWAIGRHIVTGRFFGSRAFGHERRNIRQTSSAELSRIR